MQPRSQALAYPTGLQPAPSLETTFHDALELLIDLGDAPLEFNLIGDGFTPDRRIELDDHRLEKPGVRLMAGPDFEGADDGGGHDVDAAGEGGASGAGLDLAQVAVTAEGAFGEEDQAVAFADYLETLLVTVTISTLPQRHATKGA